jgi:hypothetical protein
MDSTVVDGSILVAAGVIIPFIVSFLKDVTWVPKIKQLVSFAVAAVFAVGVTVVDKGVQLDTWQALLANLGVIFTIAQVFYTQLIKDTSVNATLENTGVGAGKVDK